MKKDDLKLIIEVITIIVLVLTAIANLWTAYETRRLVNDNIQENFYFDSRSDSIFPVTYVGETQRLNYTQFKKNSNITLEIINMGQKSIKIVSVIVHGSCVDDTTLLLAENFIIEPQEQEIRNINVPPDYLPKETNYSCSLDFEVKTTKSIKTDNIFLER